MGGGTLQTRNRAHPVRGKGFSLLNDLNSEGCEPSARCADTGTMEVVECPSLRRFLHQSTWSFSGRKPRRCSDNAVQATQARWIDFDRYCHDWDQHFNSPTSSMHWR